MTSDLIVLLRRVLLHKERSEVNDDVVLSDGSVVGIIAGMDALFSSVSSFGHSFPFHAVGQAV